MKDGDLARFLYRHKCQKRKRPVIEGYWSKEGERERVREEGRGRWWEDENEMKRGIEQEAAPPNFPWQVPLSSAADNGELIIQRSQFASIH